MKTFQEHIKEFYDLPKGSKVVLLKNPEKYRVEFLEDINPTHLKYIYGRKWNKKGNIERIAKIIIPSLLISELTMLSFLLALSYFGLFTSFICLGFYTSGIYKLFNFKLFYEVFNGKSREHSNGYLWS